MDHEQALALVPGYLDGELSLSESSALEGHMTQCDECRLAFARQREASTRLRQADLRVAAPAELVRRVTEALPAGLAPRPARRSSAWAPWALSLASVAALAVSMALYLQVPSDEQRLAQELAGNNIRSMQVDHLFDVASTDQHTVKPWFGGKLDFAPPVVDLAAQGYPLKGGRVDYLDGQRVAVMIYRDKLHPISLFVWPGGAEAAAPRFEERLGYRLAHWRAAGMNYWAITDAGAGDLQGFVSLMNKAGN
ncbi:anti-sigma factor [Achromobacter sp. HZ28]|nr:anti-sigma factor [Achromobacter sp. HZ28]OWT78686.1 anti-sigma factor [Achromobacter sp. HZ34]